MTDHDDIEPAHAASPTEHVLSELQLFGYRPFDDQPDPRPLPEGKMITGAVADIFDALVATLSDTRLEPDLEDLLWSTVNLFHRAVVVIIGERPAYEIDDGRIILVAVQANMAIGRDRDPAQPKLAVVQMIDCLGKVDSGEQSLFDQLVVVWRRTLTQGDAG